MVATAAGLLALFAGLAVLLVPLLAPELARQRDAFWGAVVLLLGLVLVTSTERLIGAPMLAVLCGGLLIGRLGLEVGQGRWRQLSPEEQTRLASLERWQSNLQQLSATFTQLLARLTAGRAQVGDWIAARQLPKTPTKRWVRQDPTPASEEPAVVSSLAQIDALLEASDQPSQDPLSSEAR